MNYDYSKRGYLLAEGCKDLIDVLKLAGHAPHEHVSPLPITQVIEVPDPIAVHHLSSLAKRKPFQVIADLMALGIYANLEQQLEFVTASRLLRQYGILAKRSS